LLIFVKTSKYSFFWVFGKVLILYLNKKAAEWVYSFDILYEDKD